MMEEVSVTSCCVKIKTASIITPNPQVSLSVDTSFKPLYLGGHHQPKSRDNLFNDNVSCIALRAASSSFSVDGKEISKARWFPIHLLATAVEEAISSGVQ